MTLLARGAKCGLAAARLSASSDASAAPARPPPAVWKNCRRVCVRIASGPGRMASSLGDRFIEIQKHVGDVEPGGETNWVESGRRMDALDAREQLASLRRVRDKVVALGAKQRE